LLDLQFLLPQGVIERVLLLHGGVAEPLPEIHSAPIRKLTEQVLNFPLDIRRRFLRSPAEVDVVFHFQAANLVLQYGQFFINGQEKNSIQGNAGQSKAGLYHRNQRPQPTPRYRQFIGLWIASNPRMSPATSKGRVRIIIADDHAVLRESLSALLSSQDDLPVEGWASNGQEALAVVQKHRTDALVLDLFMPESDGFDVLRTLDRAGSHVASVVLTGSESELDYAQDVKLGARGLVLKS